MRVRATTVLASTALALTVPVAAFAGQSATIGTGTRTCVLGPNADCHGVVHRWTVEHHGNLRGIDLRRADLRGADLRGADLRRADLRGARLRHADLRGASLRGARLGPVRPTRAREQGNGISCGFDCEGADMSYMDLQGIDLSHANLVYATILGSNMTGANLSYANLSYAILTGSTTTGWNVANAIWGDTVCPDGYQTYGPC